MMNSSFSRHRQPYKIGLRHRLPRSAQRGVVMLMVLVSIVILLLAGVALVYSTDTSLLAAGNLGFRRDLINQSGRAIAAVNQNFTSGPLSKKGLLNSSPADNYSAIVLTADGFPSGNNQPTHGIPNVLMNTAQFDQTYGKNNILDPTTQVTIRYIVDRLCAASAEGQLPDPSTCMVVSNVNDKGGTSWLQKAGGSSTPVYRISMLLTGPRNTQAFVQNTFSY